VPSTAPDTTASCESGDLRAALDRSRVYQHGATMIYVHDGFFNASEAAHTVRLGQQMLGDKYRPGGRLEHEQYRAVTLKARL
jgi:hypothetical protein